MSSFGGIIFIVLLLTLVGSLALLFITLKYYWGDRGTAPLTGAERRLQKEEEMQRRARQMEYARLHPREPRSPDFFDNRKRSRQAPPES
jgi:hypothetical protein